MLKTVQTLVRDFSPDVIDYFVGQAKYSNSLYNSALFFVKQRWLENSKNYVEENGLVYWGKFDMISPALMGGFVSCNFAELCSLFKVDPNFKCMFANAAQQTLKNVCSDIESYNGLLKEYYAGLKSGDTKVKNRPSFPKYRKKGGLFKVTYNRQVLFPRGIDPLEDGIFSIPVATKYKSDVLAEKIDVKMPDYIQHPSFIRQVIVRPTSKGFSVDWVYEDGKKEYEEEQYNPDLKYNQALGIDPGIMNWMTCVSTLGVSFIVDGRDVLSKIIQYKTRIAEYKKGKPEFYWDDYLAVITQKYNAYIRDLVNKAAKFIVNHCLKNKIGRIVFGRNKNQEFEINIGRKNNHICTQMPIAKVITRIEQLCSEYGIKLSITEESYTSKSSMLDNDFVPVFNAKPGDIGEKPDNWKPSGRRVKRGLYKTAKGFLVNADGNGAANILRKLADSLSINLNKITRKVLALPHKYNLQKMSRKFLVA